MPVGYKIYVEIIWKKFEELVESLYCTTGLGLGKEWVWWITYIP